MQLDSSTGRLLVSAVSHGVRTPLHSLVGFLELLATTDLVPEARQLLAEARRSGDELLAANDRLLTLIHVLSGEPSVPVRFSLAEVMKDVATTASPSSPVRVEVNPYLPDGLRGDVEGLRQLLVEVVGALVREGEGRRIVLSAERANDFGEGDVRVRVTVADHGSRLSAGALDHLNGSAGTPDPDLVELVAFVVRRLADRLGAELAVTQERGSGTRVTIELSLQYPTAEAVSARRGPHPGQPVATSLHVLLVEDNPVNRILAERQMARLGHRLDAVVTGRAAVRAVLAGSYDAVLMDRHLPDLDGVEATRQIRASEVDRRTPVIAITADASPGHREECIAAGMDDFLTKPLNLENLREALEAVAAARAGVPS